MPTPELPEPSEMDVLAAESQALQDEIDRLEGETAWLRAEGVMLEEMGRLLNNLLRWCRTGEVEPGRCDLNDDERALWERICRSRF